MQKKYDSCKTPSSAMLNPITSRLQKKPAVTLHKHLFCHLSYTKYTAKHFLDLQSRSLNFDAAGLETQLGSSEKKLNELINSNQAKIAKLDEELTKLKLSVVPFANTTLNSTLNSSTDSDDTGSLTPTRESEKDPLQDLVDLKREHPNQQLLFHLNINSLQSKFDELKVINSELKAGIIVLTETKIDSSYTNAQFSLPNYKIYRQDRAKGGGGVLNYITSQIPSKKLRVPFVLELIEVLAVKVELNNTDNTNAIILGLYRPTH